MSPSLEEIISFDLVAVACGILVWIIKKRQNLEFEIFMDDTDNAALTAMQDARRNEDPSSPRVAKMTAAMRAVDDELKSAAASLRRNYDGDGASPVRQA